MSDTIRVAISAALVNDLRAAREIIWKRGGPSRYGTAWHLIVLLADEILRADDKLNIPQEEKFKLPRWNSLTQQQLSEMQAKP